MDRSQKAQPVQLRVRGTKEQCQRRGCLRRGYVVVEGIGIPLCRRHFEDDVKVQAERLLGKKALGAER